TRGRFAVFVSYARMSETGSERLRSRLLEDVPESLLKIESTVDYEANIGKRILSAKKVRNREHETQYLRELFTEQGLSVTAINNYLKCPWQYFYSSLLRVPKAPNKEMIFGTVSHKALKRFFDARSKGKKIAKKKFLTWFAEALERSPISRAERAEAKERGEK